MTSKVLKLWVCWLRRSQWVAKPFTGNESWEEAQDPGVYGEEVVLVAAASEAEAAELAGDRPETRFPDVLVKP